MTETDTKKIMGIIHELHLLLNNFKFFERGNTLHRVIDNDNDNNKNTNMELVDHTTKQ